MKKMCKHESHRVIDHIWAPRYSTKEVLINVDSIKDGVEHYLLKFVKAPSMPGWYYINRKAIINKRIQGNGAGKMYVVPLNLLDDFQPIPEKECGHVL